MKFRIHIRFRNGEECDFKALAFESQPDRFIVTEENPFLDPSNGDINENLFFSWERIEHLTIILSHENHN